VAALKAQQDEMVGDKRERTAPVWVMSVAFPHDIQPEPSSWRAIPNTALTGKKVYCICNFLRFYLTSLFEDELIIHFEGIITVDHCLWIHFLRKDVKDNAVTRAVNYSPARGGGGGGRNGGR
jgi:hypothetical protein